jgi:hypothetical protein
MCSKVWVNLTNTLLWRKNPTPEDMYCMIPSPWNGHNKEPYRDKARVWRQGNGSGANGGGLLWRRWPFCGSSRWWWSHNIVKVPSATASLWWRIVCYACFIANISCKAALAFHTFLSWSWPYTNSLTCPCPVEDHRPHPGRKRHLQQGAWLGSRSCLVYVFSPHPSIQSASLFIYFCNTHGPIWFCYLLCSTFVIYFNFNDNVFKSQTRISFLKIE